MHGLLHAGLLFIHILAAIAWIGGMIFMHVALRPAAAQVLPPPQRLALVSATLERFFKHVQGAVGASLVSGVMLMTPAVQQGVAPLGWWLMAAVGLLMAAVFGFIALRLYPPLRERVKQEQWPQAGQALERLRRVVLVNMVLGLVALAAAVSTRL
jgi:uncharacterized membrane protein